MQPQTNTPLDPVQTPQQQTPPMAPVPKKSKKKLFAIVGAIVVVLALVAAGVVYFMQQQSDQSLSTPKQETSVSEAESQSDLVSSCVKDDPSASGGKYVAFTECK